MALIFFKFSEFTEIEFAVSRKAKKYYHACTIS